MNWSIKNTVAESLRLPVGERFSPGGFRCEDMPDMTEEAAEYLIKKDWEGEVRTQSEIIVIARLLGAFEGYIDFLLVPNPETITPQPKSSKDPLGSVMGEKRQLLAHQIIKR